jgi:signal transduction histidine kinase
MAGSVPAQTSPVVGPSDDLGPRGGVSAVILEDEAVIVPAEEDSPSRTRQTSAMVRRIRAIDPWRLDVLIAIAVTLEFQVELALLAKPHAPHHGAMAAGLAVWGATFALRRRAPVVTMAVGLGMITFADGLGASNNYNLYLPFFATFVATYSVGRYSTPRVAAAGAVIGVALFAWDSAIDPANDTTIEVALWAAAFVCGPILLGRLMRNRAALHHALRERVAEAERGRAERARRAVEEERERIAGELHDVVAHALGAMTVQASAARRLVADDPERARRAFAAVESSGREALTEIRRLLGVLRREDEELALAPQPSLRHVASLARRVRAAGLPVELTVEGDVEELPAGVDLTAYRVVQEALGAALEESGAGRARVRVRRRPDAVLVEVADDGRAGGGAHLPALRDRVALHGGQLLADEGRVRARLPLGGAA